MYDSSRFKYDYTIQQIVNVICLEDNVDLICQHSDFYFFGSPSDTKMFDVGMTLGELADTFPLEERDVYEFSIYGSNGKAYFIGSRETVRKRIEYIS